MTAPASYVDSLRYVVNGEQVEAGVANRAIQELKSNTDYLKNVLDALGSQAYVAAIGVTLHSSTVIGTPVYFNVITSQYEPAQAIAGKDTVVGIVMTKTSSTVGNILVAGTIELTLNSAVFNPSIVGQPSGRYYLASATPGTLTATVPTGGGATQTSVLIGDGLGRIFVLPYLLQQGATGSQGSQGPQGPQGAQGSQGGIDPSSYTWDAYRATTSALLSGGRSWYRAAGFIASTVVTFTPTNNRIYALPFLATRTGTIDRIAINVTGAAVTGGATARLGIYASGGTSSPYPSGLLLDAGTVAVDSTGIKSLTISQVLTAGTLYWFVILFEASSGSTPTALAGNDGTGAPAVIGLIEGNLSVGDKDYYAIYKTQAYGALPGTFPSSPGSGIGAGTTSPLIACRYSA